MNRLFNTAAEVMRFFKGESDRHRGQGSKSLLTLFKERRDDKVKVTENGRDRYFTVGELMVRSVYERALRGDMQAIKAWMDLKKVSEPRQGKRKGGFLVVPEQMTVEQWQEQHGNANRDKSQEK